MLNAVFRLAMKRTGTIAMSVQELDRLKVIEAVEEARLMTRGGRAARSEPPTGRAALDPLPRRRC
jgi:hypothetical protein